MVIKILGERDSPAYRAAEAIIRGLGHTIRDASHLYCDLSVAPLLTKKLNDWELLEPIKGTLIFHPSPLPYGRGPSAIRWAYDRKEPITAATWFWANSEYDGGDVCEMEIIAIDHSIKPREFYELHMIPAMQRTLERCLNGLSRGFERRVPQIAQYATYDYKFSPDR